MATKISKFYSNPSKKGDSVMLSPEEQAAVAKGMGVFKLMDDGKGGKCGVILGSSMGEADEHISPSGFASLKPYARYSARMLDAISSSTGKPIEHFEGQKFSMEPAIVGINKLSEEYGVAAFEGIRTRVPARGLGQTADEPVDGLNRDAANRVAERLLKLPKDYQVASKEGPGHYDIDVMVARKSDGRRYDDALPYATGSEITVARVGVDTTPEQFAEMRTVMSQQPLQPYSVMAESAAKAWEGKGNPDMAARVRADAAKKPDASAAPKQPDYEPEPESVSDEYERASHPTAGTAEERAAWAEHQRQSAADYGLTGSEATFNATGIPAPPSDTPSVPYTRKSAADKLERGIRETKNAPQTPDYEQLSFDDVDFT